MHNLLNIVSIPVENIYTYYLGVFVKNNSTDLNKDEYIEVKKAVSGSAIEDYFPLFIESLNIRQNWKFLETAIAKKTVNLDFSFTNCSPILTKANINYRFLLDSEDHYISNKTSFYNKFKEYDFIINYESICRNNINEKKDILDSKFSNKSVIIKPDTGSVSTGILTLQEYNYDTIKDYISKNVFLNWSVSEIFIPKLINGYISTNRIYFLVTKINNKHVISYFYKEFMNYRAEDKFTGDINDPRQLLTNLYSNDEDFVRNRFIPHNVWLSNFEKYEVEQIYAKLSSIFSIITNVLKNDLMCFNDNSISNDKIGFHIYGIDALINDKCEIKIIEINGAPAVNEKTRYYNVPDRLDYFDLIEEVVQKTLDIIYEPKIKPEKKHNFIEVFRGEIKEKTGLLYYIPLSIATKYIFIHHALEKRNWLRRTKNFNDAIDVYYGLRERYITDYSNMNYYDEIINYKMSKRMKNASIINKIEGITYYLASKDGLYKKLVEHIGKKKAHKIHPVSIFMYYNDNKEMKKYLKKKIKKHHHIKQWIVKPVHGSRGLGIKIFNTGSNMVLDIYNYIIEYSTRGFTVTDNSFKNFNGKDTIRYKQQTFKYWMICEYINNPRLLNVYNPGKKFNIRFYALLTMGKLPTLKDINEYNNENVINLYIYNDMMVYFSVLNYNDNIPEEYKDLDEKLLHDMKHLTNLEVINNLSLVKGIDINKMRRESTCMLSSILSTEEFEKILKKGKKMILKTINSTKYDLRPLNRFTNDYRACYNLLAYDTMLDSNGKLWLIEVNRGPDLMGLYENIGNKCEDMFDEMFSVCVDKFYPEHVKEIKELTLFEKYDVKYDIIN